jgi:hypothetical protein
MSGPARQCERRCFDEAEDIDAWGVGQNSCGLTGQRRWRGGGFPGRQRRVGPGSVRPLRVVIESSGISPRLRWTGGELFFKIASLQTKFLKVCAIFKIYDNNTISQFKGPLGG